jgi:hypothetical protein
MPRRDEGPNGLTQRTRVTADLWTDSAGNVVDESGRIVISAAAQALVSADGNNQGAAIVAQTTQGASLLVVSDSILAQSFDPPNSSFGCTIAKGSYFNGSAVKTTGVQNLFAENPCRLQFRAAHNLVTGDEVFLDELPSNHPLASRRYTVTVLDADEVTLNGVNAIGMPALTSGAAGTDAMAYVDMGYGNFGPLSWMLHELGYPFARIDGVMRPGASSAQIAAVIGTQWPAGPYSYGILHIGRNDSAYDEASLIALRDAMLARCGWVLVCIPFPDATNVGYTAGSLAKLKSIAAFWYAQQQARSQIRVCDLFAVVSDPTATLEAALAGLLASDNVHPQANGARLLGEAMAQAFPPVSAPRRAVARISSGSDNLLTGGRFTGSAGTVGTGVSGNVATGWTVGSRSSANVTGGYVQVVNTPAIQRRNSAVHVAGDVLDIGDGWWYVVKTGGTLNASVPAGYASATLFDSTTGVTDGTAVTFRVPKWTDSRDRLSWQFLDYRLSADGGQETMSFFQSLSVPGSVVTGDYIRGQIDVAQLGGYTKGITLRLTVNDSVPTQIARSHALGINTLLSLASTSAIRPRTLQTPRIRVPASAATMELRLTPYIGLEGLQLAVALPVVEETTAPGNAA